MRLVQIILQYLTAKPLAPSAIHLFLVNAAPRACRRASVLQAAVKTTVEPERPAPAGLVLTALALAPVLAAKASKIATPNAVQGLMGQYRLETA